jgi:hypothetical protein
MKHAIIAVLILLITAVCSFASDSIGGGVRAGTVTNRSGYFTEVFGDLYLNRLVSIGATGAFVSVDREHPSSIRRDESFPITALFKVHAPVPYIMPYAGLGEALIFHDRRSVTGSPVILVGANLSPGQVPLHLNLEYRHQFNGELDFLGGGIGVRF